MTLDKKEVFRGLKAEDFLLSPVKLREKIEESMENHIVLYYSKPKIKSEFEDVFPVTEDISRFHVRVWDRDNDKGEGFNGRSYSKKSAIVFFIFDASAVTIELFNCTALPSRGGSVKNCFKLKNGQPLFERTVVLEREKLCFDPSLLEQAFKEILDFALSSTVETCN